MNELRWILVGFGIVLLAAIYLWGRRGSRAAAADEPPPPRVRPEPPLHVHEPTLIRSVEQAIAASAQHDVAPPAEPPSDEYETSPPLEPWRGRVEPTFADAETAEMPVRPAAAAASAANAAAAPTLSSSEAPQSRRVERRKILSLRLAMGPQRIEGAKLLESLQAESLQHGKYN